MYDPARTAIPEQLFQVIEQYARIGSPPVTDEEVTDIAMETEVEDRISRVLPLRPLVQVFVKGSPTIGVTMDVRNGSSSTAADEFKHGSNG